MEIFIFDHRATCGNLGQLGLGSSRPESTRPGLLGLCNMTIEAVHVISLYNCMRHQYEYNDTLIVICI